MEFSLSFKLLQLVEEDDRFNSKRFIGKQKYK